jgi:predicted MPP superfamily phosphohydrolase
MGLAAAIGFVAWATSRNVLIGRMQLPPTQLFAMSLGFVVVVALAAAWVGLGFRWLAPKLGLVLPRSPLDRRPVRQVLLALLALTVLAYLYARFVEPRWVVVRRVPVGLVPLKGGPVPVRMVVLSDLHVTDHGEPWRSLPGRVNELEPDVIVLLGDLLNTSAALPALQRTLADMQATTAKVAVRGNWETWYWSELPLLAGTGFRWLDRELLTMKVGAQTVHLLGWDYRDQDDGEDAEPMLAPLSPKDWRIFAHHTPDLVLQVPSADLALAGHTHGGQIALPFYGAFVTLSKHGKRFERGASRAGSTWVYVNPGIGVEPAVPLRFGVRPEVTLIMLGPKQR